MAELKLNQDTTKYLYIGSALIIIMIVFLLTQIIRKKQRVYKNDQILSVITSRGLIMADQNNTKNKLIELSNGLKLHAKRVRVGKFRPLIENAIGKLQHFINNNPKHNVCMNDDRANLIHRSMADLVSVDNLQKNTAYNTVLDSDEETYYSDEQMYEYLLKNLEILIELLHGGICDSGVIDISELEKILNLLEDDLMHNGKFESLAGNELRNNYDAYKNPNAPIFVRDSVGLNDDSYEMRSHVSDRDFNGLLKTKDKIKTYQTRSEIFRNGGNVGYGELSDAVLAGDVYTATYTDY
jgi:hypothetical protein